MTAKAAKEAALGAGGILHYVTAGKLRRTDLKKIKEVNPNLILIAGGVDYGERDTAIYNAEMVRSLGLKTPIVYAGNVENQEDMEAQRLTLPHNQSVRHGQAEHEVHALDGRAAGSFTQVIEAGVGNHAVVVAGDEQLHAVHAGEADAVDGGLGVFGQHADKRLAVKKVTVELTRLRKGKRLCQHALLQGKGDKHAAEKVDDDGLEHGRGFKPADVNNFRQVLVRLRNRIGARSAHGSGKIRGLIFGDHFFAAAAVPGERGKRQRHAGFERAGCHERF